MKCRTDCSGCKPGEAKLACLADKYGMKNKEELIYRVRNKQFHGTLLETQVINILFTMGLGDSSESENLIDTPFNPFADDPVPSEDQWAPLGELV